MKDKGNVFLSKRIKRKDKKKNDKGKMKDKGNAFLSKRIKRKDKRKNER
jgi:hypothetical protein